MREAHRAAISRRRVGRLKLALRGDGATRPARHRQACRCDQTGLAGWIVPWGFLFCRNCPNFPGCVMAIVSLLTSAAKLSLVTAKCRPREGDASPSDSPREGAGFELPVPRIMRPREAVRARVSSTRFR